MPDPNTVPTPAGAEPSVRPRPVSTATALMVASLLLGFVTSALLNGYLPTGGRTLVVQVCTFAIMAFLIYMIWAGHNWARIAFAVLFALGLLFYIPTLIGFYRASTAAAAVSVVQTLLQIAALYLLFTDPGREWFTRKSSGT